MRRCSSATLSSFWYCLHSLVSHRCYWAFLNSMR